MSRRRPVPTRLGAETLEPRRPMAVVASGRSPTRPVEPVAALVLPPAPRPATAISLLTADIARNTTLRAGITYVIAAEVHVRPGVTLTIEDGVTVLIRNGRRPGPLLTANALVFDSGSRLRAASVTFAAADQNDRPVAAADNGGVFFCGSFRSGSKDGITVRTATARGPSSFMAEAINVAWLGRTDPRGGDAADTDDIDAISLIGVGQAEWRVKSVRSDFSGDDGFDATNSSITLDRLRVVSPVEDGVNLSSSFVEVRRELSVQMPGPNRPDCELFDLEVDDGPARLLLPRRAAVDLNGWWGNVYDEVSLNSLDMPRPPRRGGPSQRYIFSGVLRQGPAIVYSIKAD